MLRSKRIHDYLSAPFESFRPGMKLPADVHLYFSSNRHILVWRKGGDVLSESFIKKYRARGMKQVWIHRDDLQAWKELLQAPLGESTPDESFEPPKPAPDFVAAPPEEPPPPSEPRIELPPAPARTEEGREINSMMADPQLDSRKRVALVARAARELLAEMVAPEKPEMGAEAIEHARDAVRDVLDAVLAKAPEALRRSINEIWEMSEIEPELDHGVNVATFAVLFAMAFGRIGQDLLADIALAALLHDVGLTQVPAQLATYPWTELRGRDLQIYSRHVDEGIRLLDDVASGLSPRIRPLIQQHHERFDGSGYPLQLQGYQVNDLAQLVGLADAICSMAIGQWDGEERTFMGSFEEFERLEQNGEHKGYFNNEVFAAVLRWIRNPGSLSSKLQASEIVRSSTRDLIKQKRAKS